MKSIDSWSDLPPDPPLWVKLGSKIADFVFLPCISFIRAFTASECIERYWGTLCEESR